jgi:hypothetical protein
MLHNEPEHDQRTYVEVSMLDPSEYGLNPRPGRGFVRRTCLKIGQPKVKSPKTTGLIHAVGANMKLPERGGNSFTKFLSALCQNMQKFSGPLIEAGCRGSDIDWISPDFVRDLHDGMYMARLSSTVTNDVL